MTDSCNFLDLRDNNVRTKRKNGIIIDLLRSHRQRTRSLDGCLRIYALPGSVRVLITRAGTPTAIAPSGI